MKISKLSEHIGRGPYMFHVSVAVHDETTHYLVAAVGPESARVTAILHHYGYQDIPSNTPAVERLMLEPGGVVATLIGEIES